MKFVNILIFLVLRIKSGVSITYKNDINSIVYFNKQNITPVTEYLGLQASNEINFNSTSAVKAELHNSILLNFDICEASNKHSIHNTDSFNGKFVLVDAFSSCDFEVQYNYFHTRNASAVLFSAGDRGVPSINFFFFNYINSTDVTPMPFLVMELNDFLNLKSLITNTSPGNLTITIFPDGNPWSIYFKSPQYIIFAQIIPGLLFSFCAIQGAYYLFYHLKNRENAKLKAGTLERIKYVLKKFSVAQYVLLVEIITCSLLALHWFYANLNMTRKFWIFFQQSFNGVNTTVDILMVFTWQKSVGVIGPKVPSKKLASFFEKHQKLLTILKYVFLSIPIVIELIGDYFFYSGMTYAKPMLVNVTGKFYSIIKDLTNNIEQLSESKRNKKDKIQRLLSNQQKWSIVYAVFVFLYSLSLIITNLPFIWTPQGYLTFWGIGSPLTAVLSISRVNFFRSYKNDTASASGTEQKSNNLSYQKSEESGLVT
ncbi:hypothetical protein HK099_004799 [Clydaea vesicula]|uniref:Uncharacterized protein n=1 Tax=Clydaea vesicula TaxID=447962 RepID=A0AAD5U6P6_9FUNG|nr:hypothetical protein HK099_004799 [Clydaea vesicula]